MPRPVGPVHQGHVDHRAGAGAGGGQALTAQLGQGQRPKRGAGGHREVGGLAVIGLRLSPLAIGHGLDRLADRRRHLPHQLAPDDGDVAHLAEAHPVAHLLAGRIEGPVLIPQADELVDGSAPQVERERPGQPDQLVLVGDHLVGDPGIVQGTSDHLGVVVADVALTQRGVERIESSQGDPRRAPERSTTDVVGGWPRPATRRGHAEIGVAAPAVLEHGQSVALDRLECGPGPLGLDHQVTQLVIGRQRQILRALPCGIDPPAPAFPGARPPPRRIPPDRTYDPL